MVLEWFSECLNCHEVIFNPICPACLAVEIEAWLQPIFPYHKKITKKIEDYIRKTNNLASKTGKLTKCISCRKLSVSLCPYCFTEYVFNLLKKIKVNKAILKEFLEFFNYDFEHTGYSKDAEELGAI